MKNNDLQMVYSGVRLGVVRVVDATTGEQINRDVSQEEYDKIMDNFSEEEFHAYVDSMISKGRIDRKNDKYETGTLDIDITTDGNVDITFRSDPNFQRIRRITGYLVGTVDRFNDAKRHEVEDRVKHSLDISK